MKLSIIVPVYNEASTIESLLSRVLNAPTSGLEKEIVVIESGSTDGTREFVQRFSAQHPDIIKLVLQAFPRGKGNAVREGFRAATGDIFLIQDGDLEYDVNDYPILIEPILAGRARFVLGSRHLSSGNWKIRRFEASQITALFMNLGGVFFHGFFNLLYGQHLTDPTTMYKVFHRDCLKGLSFESNRFDFDFELVAKLIRAGFSPLEVPVSYVSRGFEEGKKVRIFRDPFTWLWAIVRFRFVPLKLEASEAI